MKNARWLLLVAIFACQGATPPTTTSPKAPSAAESAVSAPDRSADDRKLDDGRHPAEVLAFFGINEGQRVAEIFATSGYTTELLARTVGPSGVVYAENPSILPPPAVAAWTERLAKPVMKNVVRVDRELTDPLPPEASNLDVVVISLVYHDMVAAGVDRAKLNAAIFRALRPGGVYGIVDHSAKANSGSSAAATDHRIDEAFVRTEIERAGFRLDAEGAFLRNPADTRDWNASGKAAGPRRGTTDRFVLRFARP